jgi:hypothetical protein
VVGPVPCISFASRDGKGEEVLGNSTIRTLPIPVCRSITINNMTCRACDGDICSGNLNWIEAGVLGRSESLSGLGFPLCGP